MLDQESCSFIIYLFICVLEEKYYRILHVFYFKVLRNTNKQQKQLEKKRLAKKRRLASGDGAVEPEELPSEVSEGESN